MFDQPTTEYNDLKPTLHSVTDGKFVRYATKPELQKSIDVAELDGIGTLTVDGREVYVRE